MPQSTFLLGFDIGSSSVKAALMNADTGAVVGKATSPETELDIIAPYPGWAEQHPDTWWSHVVQAAAMLKEKTSIDFHAIAACGISYQMHGLVVVDKENKPLRNAVIWCDSRAVELGEKAFHTIGEEWCREMLLNSPGNFTASKMKWVIDNEPEIFSRTSAILLPGDYIAMKMTGERVTTPSGLSEGILWNFKEECPAYRVLSYYGIPEEILPEIRPSFSIQGECTREAAEALGIRPGTPVAYRGGDQPNNALSLNVLNPGEIAATAGTSGVVYGVCDAPTADPLSRVNTFVHVNHTPEHSRYGMLLCVNGCGILNSWLRRHCMSGPSEALTYRAMDDAAATVPAGAEGLVVLPYGNGAERTLSNKTVGASVQHLDLTLHTRAHLLRAAQEGIVFSLRYGIDIMKQAGVSVQTIRAGHANMFLSPLFRRAFASATGAVVELFDTDGAQGAARGAGIGAGIYPTVESAFHGLQTVETVEPVEQEIHRYNEAYSRWKNALDTTLSPLE